MYQNNKLHQTKKHNISSSKSFNEQLEWRQTANTTQLPQVNNTNILEYV